jgi:hypothetical protein
MQVESRTSPALAQALPAPFRPRLRLHGVLAYSQARSAEARQVAIADLSTNRSPWMLGQTGDFTLTAGQTWFKTQHHATFIDDLVPGSTIMLFDNQGLTTKSRVLQMGLDFSTMAADITREQLITDYTGTDLYCSIESGALASMQSDVQSHTAGSASDVCAAEP